MKYESWLRVGEIIYILIILILLSLITYAQNLNLWLKATVLQLQVSNQCTVTFIHYMISQLRLSLLKMHVSMLDISFLFFAIVLDLIVKQTFVFSSFPLVGVGYKYREGDMGRVPMGVGYRWEWYYGWDTDVTGGSRGTGESCGTGESDGSGSGVEAVVRVGRVQCGGLKLTHRNR